MLKVIATFIGGVVLSALLATSAMAADYSCPQRIKIDHQKGLVADLKSGTYRYDQINVRPDPRLFKSGDWDRFATFDLGAHRGRCEVKSWVEGFGEVNTLICECIDQANNITFTAVKSVIGSICKSKGKLKFTCK